LVEPKGYISKKKTEEKVRTKEKTAKKGIARNASEKKVLGARDIPNKKKRKKGQEVGTPRVQEDENCKSRSADR